MYWTDWDEGDSAKLWMAGMDGSNKKRLPIRDLKNPCGLVVDHEGSRLYWTDEGQLKHSNLDGTGYEKMSGE